MDVLDELLYGKKDSEQVKKDKQRVKLEVEKQSELILSNENNRKLFENFFDLYVKEEFNDLVFLIQCEKQMLTSMFSESKFIMSKRNGDNIYPYNFCSKTYFRLVDLLIKNGVLQSNDDSNRYDKYYNYLLITVCLKYISQEYFANVFKELYGGFFPNIENLTIEKCISAYNSIDFIDHHDILNISQFAYFMLEYNKEIGKNSKKLEEFVSLLSEEITRYLENKEQIDFESKLLNHNINTENEPEQNPFDKLTINDVDQLDGIEFEHYVSYLFETMGYSVVVTAASGDQGIDIIVAKNGIRLGVQVKRYISTVPNTAIQEVVAGIKHYNLQKGIVVTNNNFTKSAIELAKSNNVILWDRNRLKEIIQSAKNINNLF